MKKEILRRIKELGQLCHDEGLAYCISVGNWKKLDGINKIRCDTLSEVLACVGSILLDAEEANPSKSAEEMLDLLKLALKDYRRVLKKEKEDKE